MLACIGTSYIYSESAGGVYVHAHIVTEASVRHAILSSGSRYLSPPLPCERGNPLGLANTRGGIDETIGYIRRMLLRFRRIL